MKGHGRRFLLASQWALEKLHIGTQSYQYSPLSEEAQEIRLLTLLPGHPSSKVRVCLETTPFTEEIIPQYEALSYAWGSEENPVNIFIGPSGSHTLAVTRNLAEALPYLRYEDRPRILWIDAICVNQQDLEERGRQVRRMADIFSKATRVVAWLGLESKDTSLAIECIKTINSHVRVDWRQVTLFPTSTEKHWAMEKELPVDDRQFVAIFDLLQRPWFERLWIWQEVCLASSYSIVLCGTQMILWNFLRTAVAFLYLKRNLLRFKTIMYHNRLTLVWNLCKRSNTDRLDDLIDDTKKNVCSDPRDRIFALLSLLPDDEKNVPIRPDYTKSVYQVYENTFVQYTSYTETLSLLLHAELHQNVEGLPSWVPDWSLQRSTDPFIRGYASSNSNAITKFLENGILQVTGVSVGVIEKVSAFNLPEWASQSEWCNELIRVVASMGFGQLSKGEKQLCSFCTVLSSKAFADAYSPTDPDYLSMQKSEDALCSILQNQANPKRSLSSTELKFVGYVRRYCANRSLFLTKDKQIGLGPVPIEVGDVVTVFLGCYSCMILRPLKNGQSQVVGEAFVDGFMEGQAVGGPLPDNFDLVEKHNERKMMHYPVYYDRETGIFYPDHPVLGLLPPAWTIKSHPNEEFITLFQNQETGKTTWHDPRYLPEHLKGRGVDVRTFDLV